MDRRPLEWKGKQLFGVTKPERIVHRKGVTGTSLGERARESSAQSHASGPAAWECRHPPLRDQTGFVICLFLLSGGVPCCHSASTPRSRGNIHIYLYLLYFFTHIHLKRLRLINIFRCPVTMAIGSADIIFNLIFQLPQ